MPHLTYTVTTKGQTTIPGKVREALGIKPGDRLEFSVEGDHAILRVHLGAAALHGVLAGDKGKDKGKGLTFSEIRRAAAKQALKERRYR